MLKTFNIGKHKINNGRTFVVAEISAIIIQIVICKNLSLRQKKQEQMQLKFKATSQKSTINCKKDFVIKDKIGKFKNL